MYRQTRKAKQRRKWRPRAELPVAEQQPAALELPARRRVVIVIDYDLGAPEMHVIELFRTPRVDSYRAVVDGRDWHARIGWSRVLDGLRRALPRLPGPRSS
jgi:hypothetical protein